MRGLSIFIAAAFLAGCASTPKDAITNLENVELRPVTEMKSETIDIPAMLETANSHFSQREFQQSYDLFSAVLIHDKSHAQARIGLGDSALALGKTDVAYKALEGVETGGLSDALKTRLISSLALLSASQDHRPDTRAHLVNALKFAPNDPRLWNALGLYYDTNAQWVDSAEAYVRALSTGEARASIINNLGMSLLMQGRTKAAKEKFEQALAIEPGTDLFDNNRRLVLALEGDYDGATSNLDDRRAAMLCNDAGFIALQRGEKRLARTLIERSITINPVYSPEAEANLAAL